MSGSSAAGRIHDIWGDRTPHGAGEVWPTRVDQHVIDGVEPDEITWTRSACVLCSNGCGLEIGVSEGRMVGVRVLDQHGPYHMGMARAKVCAEHLAQLDPLLAEFGAAVVEDAYEPDFIDTLSRNISPPGERTAPTALALLHDLRDTYAAAHRTEISWIMLQQAAKAGRQSDLLDVAATGVEQTEQTWKWLRTKIKDAAPQALAT